MQMNFSTHRKSTILRDWPLVSWWIRITSPVPGSSKSSRNPQWREEVASLLFPFVFIQVLLALPLALNNPQNLISLCIVACADVAALLVKRAGKIYIAGAIILITTEFGLCSAVLARGHLDITDLVLFDLFLKSGIVAMAFFPPFTVLLVACLNCIFIACDLILQPHTEALSKYLAHNFFNAIFAPTFFQLFVAAVSFIIVRALIKEIRRADSAEEIVQLRQLEAELRKREAEQAQQLEEGIQLILQALNMAAAKVDFSMRVPLAQENILWRVGYSINNLLARLQGFKQEKVELDTTRAVASQLTECIRQGQPFPLHKWTGTSLDQVIIEINKQFNISAKPTSSTAKNSDAEKLRVQSPNLH